MRFIDKKPVCPVCQSDLVLVGMHRVPPEEIDTTWYCHRCEHEYHNVSRQKED